MERAQFADFVAICQVATGMEDACTWSLYGR